MPRGRPKKVISTESSALKYDAQINRLGGYELTAQISGKKEVVRGETLLECFEKMIVSKTVKGKCTLKVQKGDLVADMPLSPMKVKRLYFNKVYRAILEKQLNLRLH